MIMPMRKITLSSLFDGIGGWQLAAKHAGILPVWSSEIETFPAAVTRIRFPATLQLGDVTKIDGAQIPLVDIICAGSPCQDLSVAGRQEGLKGEKSRLFYTAVDIISKMRVATKGRYPRFAVWENVPGAFSSNRGGDFRAVLEALTKAEIPVPKSGRWAPAGMVRGAECDVAWRQLDAQYWGVPQRRKRVFLVADFRTGRRRAGEILFERESLRGHTPPGGKKREGAAVRAKGSAYQTAAGFKVGQGNKAGGIGYQEEKAPTLSAMNSGNKPAVLIYENHSQDSRVKGPVEKCPAISAQAGTGGNNLPLALHSYCIAGNTIDRQLQNGGNGKGVLQEISYTLNTIDRHAVFCVGNGQANQTNLKTIAGALNCMHDQQCVLGAGTGVRRLTPLECERLQGLPDGWTLIADKSCSDSARYKALGNGMAQPCADFIIKRIAEVMRMEAASR